MYRPTRLHASLLFLLGGCGQAAPGGAATQPGPGEEASRVRSELSTEFSAKDLGGWDSGALPRGAFSIELHRILIADSAPVVVEGVLLDVRLEGGDTVAVFGPGSILAGILNQEMFWTLRVSGGILDSLLAIPRTNGVAIAARITRVRKPLMTLGVALDNDEEGPFGVIEPDAFAYAIAEGELLAFRLLPPWL